RREGGMADKREGYPLTTYAVRIEGKEGWSLDEAPVVFDEIEPRFDAANLKIEELHKITQGVGFTYSEDGSPRLSGLRPDLVRAFGWTFDEVAECWRAPGEMPAEPIA